MEEENMNTNVGPTNETPTPVTPVVPVAPTMPEAPTAPVAPEAPVMNETPVAPVMPEVPVTPVGTTPVGPTEEKKEEKESNDSSKKILAAFLMLVVTAISLTTASYAWFTENTTVTVDSIDVNVGASNGIQISVDAVNWKASISNADITGSAYSTNRNQLPTQIVPVSTVGEVDSTTGFMKMYKGNLEADASTAHGYRLVATQSTEGAANNAALRTAGDYIAFDVFLLTTQATTVYLTTSSDVVATGADSGLKNAARVAFLYEGTAGVGESTDAIALHAAASNATAEQTSNLIWEPNSNVHSAGGVAQANQYGQTSFANNTVVPSYSGIKAPIPAPSVQDSITATDYQSTVATYFGTVTPNIVTPAVNTTNGTYKTLFSLGTGINKIRIYAWVEGQDYDCENNASGSNITFNIQISKNSHA